MGFKSDQFVLFCIDSFVPVTRSKDRQKQVEKLSVLTISLISQTDGLTFTRKERKRETEKERKKDRERKKER